MKKLTYIKQEKIISFITKITKKLNLKKKDNDFLIKSLVGSSMRGVDSHGIRLLPHYLKCLEQGRININPKMTFKLNMPSIGLLDADNGLGHSAAYLGSIKAIDIAKKNACKNAFNKYFNFPPESINPSSSHPRIDVLPPR